MVKWDWKEPHSLRNLYVMPNQPEKAGEDASRAVRFGEFGRYVLRAVHTRFDRVSFFVLDAELADTSTGLPSVIRQADTIEEALAGLEIVEVFP